MPNLDHKRADAVKFGRASRSPWPFWLKVHIGLLRLRRPTLGCSIPRACTLMPPGQQGHLCLPGNYCHLGPGLTAFTCSCSNHQGRNLSCTFCGPGFGQYSRTAIPVSKHTCCTIFGIFILFLGCLPCFFFTIRICGLGLWPYSRRAFPVS